MFIDDGSLYLIKAEVVVLAVIFKLVLMAFLTHLALLYYYSAGDWHSAAQVRNSAGNIMSILSSPQHRHGVARGTTKTWLISTGFLVIAFAANYTGDLIQLAWNPAWRDFALPVDVYLTNTYNVTVPYDLYSQFTVNGSIVPDALLDSQYNPVLNYTTLSPSTINGEPISYFTIDYNGATVLDNINKPHPCSPDVSVCSGEMQSYVSTPCPETLRLPSSTYTNGTKNIPIPCSTLYEFVPVTSYNLPVQSRIGQSMTVSDDAWHNDNKPNPIGTNIQHSFRLSGIPYPDGRGLILQHNVVSYFPLSMDELARNGTTYWPSTKCAETLAKFHFTNTTEACSNTTLNYSNVTQRMFINTVEGPNESTMRYCIISISGVKFVFSLNCGMQYLKVGYLGPHIPNYKNDTLTSFYIQNQGSSDVWCSGSGDGFQRCILDDQSKSFRSISSRGYGTFYASNTVPVEQQTISLSDVDIQIAKIDEMTNLTREIFLREYSIGSNDYIHDGVPVRGVGHARMLRYRINVSVFAILAVLVTLLLVSVVVLHLMVLPNHYTASVFDVFRIATSPDLRRVNNPGKANQYITLHFNSDGNIAIANNGTTIGPLNDEYPLDSRYSPDSSKVSLLAT
ncbi:hypothetical protein BGX26_006790 [Mortierella sp. AD094]|nr:hypothetical protein BGX26_006790 [Mortierella sp. AD094]